MVDWAYSTKLLTDQSKRYFEHLLGLAHVSDLKNDSKLCFRFKNKKVFRIISFEHSQPCRSLSSGTTTRDAW